MHDETITFQLATHHLTRVAVRLECLFLTIEQACEETHPVIHHYALKNTIEIIKLIEKPELKSRFLKELMRIEHRVNKANMSLSNMLYSRLLAQVQYLNHVAGRFGESIHNDLFLQSIRFSQAGDKSESELYSPQLLFWLENEPYQRQTDLQLWLKQLKSLNNTVHIYLSLLRNTAEFDQVSMLNGYYQCSLPSKTSCHLILLRMDKKCGFVPKMQLGHHGLSLRLCTANSMKEVKNQKTAIDLAICQL